MTRHIKSLSNVVFVNFGGLPSGSLSTKEEYERILSSMSFEEKVENLRQRFDKLGQLMEGLSVSK